MKDGGPAFPTEHGPVYKAGYEATGPRPGMSLRDYFAAKALVAIGSPSHLSNVDSRDRAYRETASNAYRLADAMLKARER